MKNQGDTDQDRVFGALARLRLPDGEFELLPGITFRPTYVHVMAHPMVAFSPPEGGKHHSGPWQALEGRCESDTALIEIVLKPTRAKLLPHAEDVLRLIAATIRLLSARPVYLAAVSNKPLTSESAQSSAFHMRALEPLPVWREDIPELTADFIILLRELLIPASILFRDEDVFQAFTLADSVWWLPAQGARMVSIWTAAEVLFRLPEQGKGKELAKRVRRYLGRSPSDGDRRYQDVERLYRERGRTAHSGRVPDQTDLYDSFMIVREIILRAIADGERPPTLTDMVPLWEQK